MLLDHVDGDIINLQGVGDGDERTTLDLHRIGLIVVDPVGHILKTLLGQDIRRVKGFGKPWPHPTPGSLACSLLDKFYGAPNGVPLIFFQAHHPLSK